MIRFVQHTDIDPKRWDDAVRQSLSPTILCTYDMLNILTDGMPWNALILDDYAAVLPLPERTKWHIHYLYTPFFIAQMGIFSAQPVTAQLLSDFLKAIPRRYQQIDLLLNVHNDATSLDVHTLSLVSHQMDLNRPYEQLYADYSKNTQRNIKSANKQGLYLTEDEPIIRDIVALFCNSKGQEKAVHYEQKDYDTLVCAAEQLHDMQRLDVVGVRNEANQLIAGALFVRDYQRLWFWFSGRDSAFSETKAMFFLLDEYIKKQAGTPYLLDFNGSMNENVARLYKSFGGEPYTIPMVNHTPNALLRILFQTLKRIH